MKDEKEFSAVKNSIQTRLSGVMLLVLIFALGINVFIFAQIRTAVGRIDAVFSSNTAINELSDSIEQVESTVYEYLNTNSSQALENYYRYEQNYRNLLEDLNDRNLDNEAKMLEKTSEGCQKLIWIRQMKRYRQSEAEMLRSTRPPMRMNINCMNISIRIAIT